jgi:hypothetical protein
MLLNVHMDGVGVEVGRLDWTTDATEGTEGTETSSFLVGHSCMKESRPGKESKNQIVPCFSRWSPWPAELHSTR